MQFRRIVARAVVLPLAAGLTLGTVEAASAAPSAPGKPAAQARNDYVGRWIPDDHAVCRHYPGQRYRGFWWVRYKRLHVIGHRRWWEYQYRNTHRFCYFRM